MTRIETRPLSESDLPAAGRLLAERQRRHRAAQPLLPSRYEVPAAAEAEVAAAWKADDASGALALRDGEPVGFLLGAPRTSPVWGPNVWVEAAGHAVDEAEVLRDLYAVAAAGWVERGWTAHYTLVPSHDETLVRSWFSLGFGQQHAHAVRAVPAQVPAPPDHLQVRRARADDIPRLAELAVELPRHQAQAPTFSAGETPTVEEEAAEWAETLADPVYVSLVVEHAGEVVGCAVGCPVEQSGAHSGLARPDDAGLLAFAVVDPSTRGIGAGRALGEAVLAWSAERGHDSIVTDWRTTNLLSSRAWPALGFEQTFLRLHRLIGY